MQQDAHQSLLNYALRLLSFRPRSVKEIHTKLKKFSVKRNFPDKLVTDVISELKEQKFLSDEEFAKWWVEQRHTHKPKGQKAIKIELLHKGIDKQTIEDSLHNKDDDISEYGLAMKVVEKKLIRFKNLSGEKMKIKVRDLLLRRGFDWETIYKVIDEISQRG